MDLPLVREKKPQPSKPKEPPVILKKPDEEEIKDLLIQDLNLKVTTLAEALSGSLTEVNKKFESYDVQVKDTNEKITALGQAVSILNDEFSKFMETLQAKLAPTSVPSGNTPPGTTVISSERASPENPPVATEQPPASTGDKLFQWANLLSSLAGPSQPSGGGGANANELLQLVLKLQDNAEERALKRLDTSIKSITTIASLFTGKKVEVPEEIKTEAITKHL